MKAFLKNLYTQVKAIGAAGDKAAATLKPILARLVRDWNVIDSEGKAIGKPKTELEASVLCFDLSIRPALVEEWVSENPYPAESKKTATQKEKDNRAIAVMLWKVQRNRFASNLSYLKRAAGLTAAGQRKKSTRTARTTGTDTTGTDSAAVVIPEPAGKTPQAEKTLIQQVMTALAVKLGVSVEIAVTRVMAVYSTSATK